MAEEASEPATSETSRLPARMSRVLRDILWGVVLVLLSSIAEAIWSNYKRASSGPAEEKQK